MLLLSITLDLGLLLLDSLHCGCFLPLHHLGKPGHALHGSLVLCRSMLHLGHLFPQCIHLVLLFEQLALQFLFSTTEFAASLGQHVSLFLRGCSPRGCNLLPQPSSEVLHSSLGSLVFVRALLHF